jgi:hypothetical protein
MSWSRKGQRVSCGLDFSAAGCRYAERLRRCVTQSTTESHSRSSPERVALQDGMDESAFGPGSQKSGRLRRITAAHGETKAAVLGMAEYLLHLMRRTYFILRFGRPGIRRQDASHRKCENLLSTVPKGQFILLTGEDHLEFGHVSAKPARTSTSMQLVGFGTVRPGFVPQRYASLLHQRRKRMRQWPIPRPPSTGMTAPEM